MPNDLPAWWELLNVEDSKFERSTYAGQSMSGKGKFRIRDLNILRKVAPELYESAAKEVKEENDYLFEFGRKFQKLKLGRKLGSIPSWDLALHPELANDPKAQDKYWKDHREFMAPRPT